MEESRATKCITACPTDGCLNLMLGKRRTIKSKTKCIQKYDRTSIQRNLIVMLMMRY